MVYLAPAQLIDGPESLNELSELFGVLPALLKAAIAGENLSGWDAEDQLSALEALQAIDDRIVQATAEVDVRLAKRGYVLPLDPAHFPVLVTWTRAIARYHLHPQREGTTETTGRIERDYRDAIRALDQIADGKLSLGANDPTLAQDENAGAQVISNPRRFSRDSLGGL
ncbi:DUF1320 domain-containing protein [Lysobacter oculi]|uniref:DUF1320 domain-containing protein n=1 Tax=Solilutibacter oculi TaxID=2698682 RepID=A0A344J3V1_9GAMM|nr:DUF1320 domain-containing protein [Lysobacter oculi]AXA83711.1 DUF1320 domain-containing protein [Lysobacter oculi]